MRLPGFAGPSAQQRSLPTNAERTINLVFGVADSGTPLTPHQMFNRPGVAALLAIASGPVRAEFYEAGTNRSFVVVGSVFAEIFPNDTAAIYGTVAVDSQPASIASNGTGGFQLVVASAGVGYLLDLRTNAFSVLTGATGADGFPDPVQMVAFCDGYCLALKAQTNQFNISQLEDWSLWDASDVAQVSQVSTRVVSLLTNPTLVFLLGTQNSQIWVDTGAPTFPFAPYAPVVINVGVVGPWAATVVNNSVFFVGATAQGQPKVYRIDAYEPQSISTKAVEFALSQAGDLSDVVLWSLQIEGYTFVLIAGLSTTTWCYELSTGQWTEWAHWDAQDLSRPEPWVPFCGWCHMFAWGRHYVGDRRAGMIYAIDFDIFADQLPAGFSG